MQEINIKYFYEFSYNVYNAERLMTFTRKMRVFQKMKFFHVLY